MFTAIQDEVNLLIQDIRMAQSSMIIEQENNHNPNLFNQYEGGIKQLEWVSERVTIASINIDDLIENIMKNAVDGNYSAKMKLVDDENELLRRKIGLMQDQIDSITNNLNKENEARKNSEIIKYDFKPNLLKFED